MPTPQAAALARIWLRLLFGRVSLKKMSERQRQFLMQFPAIMLTVLGLGMLPAVQAAPAAPSATQPDSDPLTRSASGGDSESMLALGDRFFLGDGIAKNPAQAVYWYRLAAETGHSAAM